LHDVELPQLIQYPFYNTGSKLAHNTLNVVLQDFYTKA